MKAFVRCGVALLFLLSFSGVEATITGITTTADNGVYRVTSSQLGAGAVIDSETVILDQSASQLRADSAAGILVQRSQIKLDADTGTGNDASAPITYGARAETTNKMRVIDNSSILAGPFTSRHNIFLSELSNSKVIESNDTGQMFVYTQSGAVITDAVLRGINVWEVYSSPSFASNITVENANYGYLNWEAGRLDFFNFAVSGIGIADIWLGAGNGGNNHSYHWNNDPSFDNTQLRHQSANNQYTQGNTISWEFRDRDTSAKLDDVLVIYRDDSGGAMTEQARYVTNTNGRLAGTYDSQFRTTGADQERLTLYVQTAYSDTSLSTYPSPGGGSTYGIVTVTPQIEIRSYLYERPQGYVVGDDFSISSEIGKLNSDTSVASYQPFLLGVDKGITETDRATVMAYTELENTEKLYDRIKAEWRANDGYPIVTKNGSSVDLGAVNLVIDATATQAYAYTPGTDTITIKASQMNETSVFSKIQTTGTITLQNGATYGDVILQDVTGSRLKLKVSGVVAGTRVYIENASTSAELVNATSTGTEFSADYLYTGNVGVNVIVAQAGYVPITTAGTITASGLSVSPLFLSDIFYAASAGVTGVTLDFVTQTITISEDRTLQEIYDYVQQQSATLAYVGYGPQISTNNGIDLSLSGWDLILNPGITLDGEGKTLDLGAGTVTGVTDGVTGGALLTRVVLRHSSGSEWVPVFIGNLSANDTTVLIQKTSDQSTVFAATSTGGEFRRFYNKTADFDIDVHVAKPGYTPIAIAGTIDSNGVSFSPSFAVDPFYLANTGITGIGLDFGAQTIAISEDTTIQKIYDYIQQQLVVGSNIQYGEPITTADGDVMQLLGWDLTIDPGVTLDGEGKILDLGSGSVVGITDGVTGGVLLTSVIIRHDSGSEWVPVFIGNLSDNDTIVRIQDTSDQSTLFLGVSENGSFRRFFDHTSDVGIKISLAKIGYLPTFLVGTIGAQGITETPTFVADGLYNRDGIDYGLNPVTGITLDFVNKTAAITSETDVRQLYDYVQQQTATMANVGYNAQIATADGQNYFFDWDISMTGAGELTGDTKIVLPNHLLTGPTDLLVTDATGASGILTLTNLLQANIGVFDADDGDATIDFQTDYTGTYSLRILPTFSTQYRVVVRRPGYSEVNLAFDPSGGIKIIFPISQIKSTSIEGDDVYTGTGDDADVVCDYTNKYMNLADGLYGSQEIYDIAQRAENTELGLKSDRILNFDGEEKVLMINGWVLRNRDNTPSLPSLTGFYFAENGIVAVYDNGSIQFQAYNTATDDMQAQIIKMLERIQGSNYDTETHEFLESTINLVNIAGEGFDTTKHSLSQQVGDMLDRGILDINTLKDMLQ